MIAALEFSFQLYLKMRQIDQVPVSEFPMPTLTGLVFETDDEVHGVVPHFVRRDFGFKVKRAEAAVATASLVKLRIQIKDAIRFLIDETKIGITGTLDVTV